MRAPMSLASTTRTLPPMPAVAISRAEIAPVSGGAVKNGKPVEAPA